MGDRWRIFNDHSHERNLSLAKAAARERGEVERQRRMRDEARAELAEEREHADEGAYLLRLSMRNGMPIGDERRAEEFFTRHHQRRKSS